MTRRSSKIQSRTHLVIPDTQVDPGRPVDHLDWIGNYCYDRYAGQQLTRIHLGDHWNMGSLSSYDKKGGRQMEGRRVSDDIAAGNAAFDLLDRGDKRRRAKWDDHFLMGNHENRVQRAYDQDATLINAFPRFDTKGWQVHDFLDPVNLDGILYAHYFYNPNTGRPYSGANVETRLKQVGCSFTMGHQQGLKVGRSEGVYGARLGLVAGSCYLHPEDYLGPQGNCGWQGIVVCNNVHEGQYDIMTVSLDYLCQRYEGVRLADYAPRRFA